MTIIFYIQKKVEHAGQSNLLTHVKLKAFKINNILDYTDIKSIIINSQNLLHIEWREIGENKI